MVNNTLWHQIRYGNQYIITRITIINETNKKYEYKQTISEQYFRCKIILNVINLISKIRLK